MPVMLVPLQSGGCICQVVARMALYSPSWMNTYVISTVAHNASHATVSTMWRFLPKMALHMRMRWTIRILYSCNEGALVPLLHFRYDTHNAC